MGRGGYRSPAIEMPNEWLGDETGTTWEYGDYRHCYLTIRKLTNGKYKPAQGAFNDIDYPGHDLPACGYFEYDTFEEAANHCFEYVDYIRDHYDAKAKESLHNELHRLRPDVFPK